MSSLLQMRGYKQVFLVKIKKIINYFKNLRILPISSLFMNHIDTKDVDYILQQWYRKVINNKNEMFYTCICKRYIIIYTCIYI